jgi:hypothetical protein
MKQDQTNEQAVEALERHVMAIQELRPQINAILATGRESPLFGTVATETHFLAGVVAGFTLFLRG